MNIIEKYLGLALLCVLPITLSAQTLSWDTTLIEIDDQVPVGSCTFGNNILMPGGNNNRPGTGNFSELIILDSTGQIKSRRPMQDTSLVLIEAVGLIQQVKGEPYLYGSGANHFSKIDTMGNVLWTRRYAYPFLQSPFNDFIQLRDKSVVAAGFRQFAGTGWDYFVTRIDSLGNTLWQIQYPHPNDQEALAITEMFDGSLIVGGNDGGKFRIIRIGLDGRFIQGYTWPPNTGGNRIRNTSMALHPTKNLITSSDAWNGTLINDHQVIIFDKNLNVLLDTIDDLAPADFIEVNADSSFYLCGADENDNVFFFNMTFPYDRLDSITISTGSNWKFPQSFSRINDSSAFIVGVQDNPSPNDNDYWYGRLDGLKKPWVPDPCLLSPPRALLSYEYNYPVLTLYDSSKSGLKYHDTVYTWQWNTSVGVNGTDDSLQVFFDTALSKTLNVQLIISNWYECRDTANITLNFDPTGISTIKDWDVKVYPNPASDYLNIEFSENLKQDIIFELYDIQGVKHIQLKSKERILRPRISELPNGLYFYKIGDGKNSRMGKVVKY